MQVSIQERVADAVRGAIVRGDYAPGAALSEVTLAEELGVSRTPVREALKQLATEGLVHVVARVGTFVAEPTRRDVVELLELKELFEGLAARLVAGSGNAAVLEPIAATEAACGAFHEAVVAASDNSKLQLTYRWHMNQLPGGHPPCDASEHGRILDRLRSKDPFGAEDAMRDHVRAARRAAQREGAA
jgi:DNA-binding GntR family transcriptional regulator